MSRASKRHGPAKRMYVYRGKRYCGILELLANQGLLYYSEMFMQEIMKGATVEDAVEVCRRREKEDRMKESAEMERMRRSHEKGG